VLSFYKNMMNRPEGNRRVADPRLFVDLPDGTLRIPERIHEPAEEKKKERGRKYMRIRYNGTGFSANFSERLMEQ